MHAAVAWIAVVWALPASRAHAQRQNLPRLVDVTRQAGITFVHNVGDDDMDNIIESNGAGCAFFDYDGDGDLDIYLLNGAYVDGVSGVRGRRNKDKLTNALYRNNGDGTFTNVARATGIDNALSAVGSTFLDYDGDGYLDLYVGNYLTYDPGYQYFYAAQRFPGPLAYHGQPDVLYHNDGDGTFTDVTRKAGVYNPEGRAMGVTSGDIDDDGDCDIFVANDAMENYLYRNNGDGTFTDIAVPSGTAFGQRGEATSAMSGEFGDLDADGRVDIAVPDMAYCSVYLNLGGGLFEERSAALGIAAACGQYTSWSANYFDFDHDGYGDLFITNGQPHRMVGEEALLLRNDRGRRFVNVSHLLGPDFQEKFVGRGSAVGDYDNDGDLDVLVLNLGQRPRLLRNDGGNRGSWVMVRLVGTTGNRDGIGARVRVTAGGTTQTRLRVSSSGYLSQSDPRLHFGLGDAPRIDRIEIRWPSGTLQTLDGQRPNQVITVTEPAR